MTREDPLDESAQRSARANAGAGGSPTGTSSGRAREPLRTRDADAVFQSTLLLVFLGVFVLLSLAAPKFFSVANQFNILRQAAPILIVGVGMTLVITTAGVDLSVGSGLALIGVVSAMALGDGWSTWTVIPAMAILGLAIGFVNGYLAAYQGIPAFIVTLASLSVLRGSAQALTRGYSIPIDPAHPFLFFGRGRVSELPAPALVAVAMVVAGYIVLNHSRFGLHVTGIGSNEEAVRRAGVDVRRVKLAVYMLSGLSVAIGGMITAARLASGSSYTGVAFELQVIAAVIVGGTNLFGGDGRIGGTVLGTLLLAMLANGLILMNVSPFYLQIIEGLVILLAIWFNLKLGRIRPAAVR